MGDDDELGSLFAAVGESVLADGLDRDPVLGKGRGHLGEHARPVGDVEADVIAGEGSSHVHDGEVGIGRLTGSATPGDEVPGAQVDETWVNGSAVYRR